MERFKNVFVMLFVCFSFDVNTDTVSDNKAHKVYSKQSNTQPFKVIYMQKKDSSLSSVCAFPLKVLRNKNVFVKLKLVYFNQAIPCQLRSLYCYVIMAVCCCSRSVSFPTVKQPGPVSPPCGQID